jgi:cyclophilin family peptidyl-prolyl cis-trans isomerase/HEAT repeat protein
MTRRGLLAVVVALLIAAVPACGSPPPVLTPPEPPPPEVPADRKVAWILRLEQQRILRDPALPPSGEPPATPGTASVTAGAQAGAGATQPRALRPATQPDLIGLARDPDGGIRARATLAVGRVGMASGLPVLAEALMDADELVRTQAAFAIGLIGAPAGVEPLTRMLAAETSAVVRARAIEALGLIGERSAAPAVVAAARGCATTLAPLEPDDERSAIAPEVDLCRLALFALVRLRDYDALAQVALDAQGQPAARWWPVAYALQRIGDPRAAPALLTLASGAGIYARAFALRGLAEAGDARARPIALALAADVSADLKLRIAAVRALARIGGAEAVDPLLALLATRGLAPNLALEVVAALGALGDARAFDVLVDRWSDRWPAMRAAALAAAARVNRDSFLMVISSLDRDPEWSVRAALADVYAGMPADRVLAAVEDLAADPDVRVRAPALDALARLDAPEVARRLVDALDAPDFNIRATAARVLGGRRLVGSAPRLGAAYTRGLSDATPSARLAAIGALAELGGADAIAELRVTLTDPDWPVRLAAAAALRRLGETAEPQRPAPLRLPETIFESPELLHPRYTPFAFVETTRGTIEIELDVVQAPLTVRNFVELAKSGFFSGVRVHRLIPHFVIQTGDPRGDGAGGPGYTIRDELNPAPYVRGTVGMALEGPDTGGSQFFITLSPQPHLDGRYTAFGRVRRGLDLLDDVRPGDTVVNVRIWEG